MTSCKIELEPSEELSFASETSCHGVNYISKAKTMKSRLFWSVAVGTSVVLMLVVEALIISAYVQSPTVTSIEVKSMKPENVRFPDVLVCPMNWANISKAAALGFSPEMLRAFAQLYMSEGVPDQLELMDNLTLVLKRPGMGIWTGSDMGIKLTLGRFNGLVSPFIEEMYRNGVKIKVQKYYNQFQSLTRTQQSELTFTVMALESCGCVELRDIQGLKDLHFLGNVSDFPTCLPEKTACLKAFAKKFEDARSMPLPSCRLWSYDVQMSSVRLRSNNSQYDVQDLIQINIGFENFRVTRTRDVSTVSLTGVIGSIGGTSGVFIGASVITILECLTAAGRSLLATFRRRSHSFY